MTVETFDLSSYLSAHEKASDRLRNRYGVLILVCGTLALFILRIHSFDSFPSELEYIDSQTESLNTTSGELKAYEYLRERTPEKAFGEVIQEQRSAYSADLAATFCAVVDRRGSDSRPQEVKSRLEDESLSSEEARQRISARKKELLVLGTGFHIPIINEVVEAEHVPLIASLLVTLVAVVVAVTAAQWLSSLRIVCIEARSAGVSRKAQHLLSAQSGIFSGASEAKSRYAARLAVWLVHLIPMVLLLLLYYRHSYIFFSGKAQLARQLSVTFLSLYVSIAAVFALALFIAARSRALAENAVRALGADTVQAGTDPQT